MQYIIPGISISKLLLTKEPIFRILLSSRIEHKTKIFNTKMANQYNFVKLDIFLTTFFPKAHINFFANKNGIVCKLNNSN